MIDELEWKTRRDRINSRLRALNPAWNIGKYQPELETIILDRHAVEEFPTANGPADDALFVRGKLLGIIEAKKVGVGLRNVLEQAKRYSKGAFNAVGNWAGYRVPFLYATNGEIIWFLDVRNERNLSRQLSNFHSSDALHEFFQTDKVNGCERLESNQGRVLKLTMTEINLNLDRVIASRVRGDRGWSREKCFLKRNTNQGSRDCKHRCPKATWTESL